jgi:hypothetical protein
MEINVGELSNTDPEDGEGAARTSNTSDPPGELRSQPPAESKGASVV